LYVHTLNFQHCKDVVQSDDKIKGSLAKQ